MPKYDTWTWSRVYERLEEAPPGKLWGVPRGGQIIAGLTGRAVDTVEEADVIVDDIYDSGATGARYAAFGKPFWTLARRETDWVQFPWEATDTTQDIADTVRRQLEWIGENPMREGLVDTPRRVIRTLGELTGGYQENPETLLQVHFEAPCDQMILVRDIPYASLCEHHLLPFTGEVTIAYIPKNNRVVGLSKLPRLVSCFARRLQIQERFTEQIAQALETHLIPLGVGVAVSGTHTCMQLRGVRSSGTMITTALHGAFREDARVRAEFLAVALAR